MEFSHFLVDVSILRKWNADGNYFVVRQNTVKPSNEDMHFIGYLHLLKTVRAQVFGANYQAQQILLNNNRIWARDFSGKMQQFERNNTRGLLHFWFWRALVKLLSLNLNERFIQLKGLVYPKLTQNELYYQMVSNNNSNSNKSNAKYNAWEELLHYRTKAINSILSTLVHAYNGSFYRACFALINISLWFS